MGTWSGKAGGVQRAAFALSGGMFLHLVRQNRGNGDSRAKQGMPGSS